APAAMAVALRLQDAVRQLALPHRGSACCDSVTLSMGVTSLQAAHYPGADAAQAERARGRLKIPQFHGEKIRAHRLNTLLLPLVGIDSEGYRLGQGGGYYDASLAATRHRLQPHKIGVGFACQRHNGRLPREAHDMRLDGFVCEHGWRRF
ncbi:MAG TPA: 5-formyltetrahydrofolate cyclo-ligase, partial [Neisseria sp.]|nr:5-formyltetrahydrofolate cyclo-ligase [Neisseria sp.]